MSLASATDRQTDPQQQEEQAAKQAGRHRQEPQKGEGASSSSPRLASLASTTLIAEQAAVTCTHAHILRSSQCMASLTLQHLAPPLPPRELLALAAAAAAAASARSSISRQAQAQPPPRHGNSSSSSSAIHAHTSMNHDAPKTAKKSLNLFAISARFASTYPRVDSAAARDFDRPLPGYSYEAQQGSSSADSGGAAGTASLNITGQAGAACSSAGQADFMEEITDEYSYAGPSSSRSSTASHEVRSGVSSSSGPALAVADSTHARADILPTATSSEGRRAGIYSDMYQCVKGGDLDSALAWFREAPSLDTAPLSYQPRRLRWKSTVRVLELALLQTRPHDINTLCTFALICAAKGFAHSDWRRRTLAHIARYSTYERLSVFWDAYTSRAREAYAHEPERRRVHLEQFLGTAANILIRAQCLASRYVDSLNLLRDVRASQTQRILQDPHTEQSGSIDGTEGESSALPPVIEEYTYELLLQEVTRHSTHPQLAREIAALAKLDYPDATASASKNVKAGGRTTAGRRPRLAGRHRSHASPGMRTAGRSVRSRVAGPLSSGPMLRLGPSAASSRVRYNALVANVQRGRRPTRRQLADFRTLCHKERTGHLYRMFERQMPFSQVELHARRLQHQVAEGQMPNASELSRFIDDCRTSRNLRPAKQLGAWLEGLPNERLRSLWATARMLALLRLGPVGPGKHARRVLHLFSSVFSTVGLPEPITAYLQANFPSSLAGSAIMDEEMNSDKPLHLRNLQRPKSWASSHTLTLAIRAWLLLDPSSANLQATYNSFLRVTYDYQALESSTGITRPVAMLPDQVSYQIFIDRFAKLDMPERAFQVLTDMRSRGVMPSAHNWDAVLGGFANVGNERMVEAILSRMDDAARESAREAKSVQERGDVEESEQPFEAFFTPSSAPPAPLRQRSSIFDDFAFSPPGIVSYTTVIRGLCNSRRVDAALAYRQKLYSARTPSGARLYRWGENAKTDNALAILKSMENMQAIGGRRAGVTVLQQQESGETRESTTPRG